MKQAGQQQAYRTDCQQKSGETIHPVSPLHETHKLFSHNLTILSPSFAALLQYHIKNFLCSMIMRHRWKINKLLIK